MNPYQNSQPVFDSSVRPSPLTKEAMQTRLEEAHQLEAQGQNERAEGIYTELFWANAPSNAYILGCATKELEAGLIYAKLKSATSPAIADFLYGKIFLIGANVKPDIVTAIKHLGLAFNQEYPLALDNLKSVFLAGQGLHINPTITRTILKAAYQPESCNWDPEVLYQFAQLLEHEPPPKIPLGNSLFSDSKKAACHFYQLAAKQGHTTSIFKYVEFITVNGTKKEYEEAHHFLTLAVSNGGNVQALLNSFPTDILVRAHQLWNSKDTGTNESDAIELYAFAAQLGDPNAMFSLYQIYHFGMGQIASSDAQRQDKANNWLNLAAKANHPEAKEAMVAQEYQAEFHQQTLERLNKLATGTLDDYFDALTLIKNGLKKYIEGADQKLAIFVSIAYVKAILWLDSSSSSNSNEEHAIALLTKLAEERMCEAQFKLYEIYEEKSSFDPMGIYKGLADYYLELARQGGHQLAIDIAGRT